MNQDQEISTALLKDIAVLDLADEQESFCSQLLAALGATVTAITAPKRQTRRWKRFFCDLLEKNDMLVESLSHDRMAALGLNHAEILSVNPEIIHLTITGFGRSGPKRDYRSSDSVAAAFGGQMYLTRRRTGPPAMLFPRQSSSTASLFGAVAALLALRRRRKTGKGAYVDLSIQEAVCSALDPVMIDYFTTGLIAGTGEQDANRAFTVLPCRDGFVHMTLFRDWETLVDLLDAEGKAADLTEARWQKQAYREEHRDHVIDVVSAWTAGHTRHELFELGQAMRLAWAPVVARSEVLQSPQLKARFFSTKSGFPFRFRRSPSAAPVSAPLLSGSEIPSTRVLKGIRVIDLTRMLSGPYATRILGDFGAEVIKVQSRKTAHGAEHNSTPYFKAWNRNKRSICLDLDHPEAREIFLRLVSVSDIVIENFSPRVMTNWGLSYERLAGVKPDLIMASISAMGQTGPWRDFVGFAPTFHALSGIMVSASRGTEMPADIANSFADVVAGLYAALSVLAALHARDLTGSGCHIDLSAYESLCSLTGFGASHRDSGAEAFCGCYPCSENDRWCVIDVATEHQWQRLCEICGMEELKSGRPFALWGKEENRAIPDSLIARWTARHKSETVIRRLQKAGISAGIVQNAADLAHDRQLAARNFFINDKGIIDRSALWPWHEKPNEWKPAPRLGADNRRVYRILLGLSEPEFQSLIRRKVIY